jgi:hypothetical protein
MKKMLLTLVTMLAMTVGVSAQSAIELAKQQKELNKVNREILNQKPVKDARKEAKKLRKEGWKVPAGEMPIEKQISQSLLYRQELMAGEHGTPTTRYIMRTGIATGGSYNVAHAMARASALNEVAGLLNTEIVGAWQLKQDNRQESQSKTLTNDQFNQRVKAIVEQTLTNIQPFMAIYRMVGDNFEVQVSVAADKKEIAARLKQKLQQELEDEGDELLELVDERIKQSK